jgi:two-component system chemotaxis sensor kinase CheA
MSDRTAKTNASQPGVLLDAAAEALILLDTGDVSSVAELIERVGAVACAFGDTLPSDHPAERARAAAAALADGDLSALAPLEAALIAIKGEIDRAASGKGRPRATKPPPAAPAEQGASAADAATAATEAGAMPLAGDEELLRDFGVRAAEHLDDADERLLRLDADPTDRESIDAVFRAFHMIKGMAGFLALDAISHVAHEAEGILAAVRAEGNGLTEQAVRGLLISVDTMRILVAETSGVGHTRPDDAPATGTVPGGGSASGAPVRSATGGTVRVGEERLDALLDAIGELVIGESMVSASVRGGASVAELGTRLDQLDKITRELQQMATSLRMVPLRAVFRRMARLVHDVSDKSGKRIELVTTGEDTELDKTVVDRIEDPLVHALRNAIDHGVETAEERRAAGKPEVARIELRAFHSAGSIHIEVADDGRGLDAERIRERAVTAGAISPDDALDGRSLLDVLCMPGFSTAEVVTDVSGRGVGMDVVRRTVEELRGRLEVASAPGRGTTFSIRLPVTHAIIDGMVLRVGVDRFIVPLLAIERSIRPTAAQITTIAGRGEMVAAEGEPLLPLVRLHRLFSIPDAEEDPSSAVVVIVSDGGVRAGLLACELLGQQQTVIKPLGDGLPDMPGIAGGAVMPDGRVGLILDAAGIVRSANDGGGE